MRAAIVTTAFVIAALFVWSGARERERRSASAQNIAPRLGPDALPDVAAAPREPVHAERDAASESAPVYETATRASAREHVVAEGETLTRLAERYYGDAARADAIYRANRDRIRDPERLHAGQTLVIP
jgi:nucleoid-associated protein YgaU